ncbi:Metalloprotease LoiP [Nymphon striatum]|nr:Metalloprotease LoiP [Nymphon striatum]
MRLQVVLCRRPQMKCRKLHAQRQNRCKCEETSWSVIWLRMQLLLDVCVGVLPFDETNMTPADQFSMQCIGLAKDQVHIYEIEPINGLAAPDGRFITRGFFNKYKEGEVNAAEMASVIAHELGHVALGHSRRRMIDFSGQNAIRVALATVLGRIIPGVGVWIANMLTTMLAARRSRSDEYEADAYASALLTKAGIGTAPQKSHISQT